MVAMLTLLRYDWSFNSTMFLYTALKNPFYSQCHPILDGLFSSSIANLRTLRKESGRGLLPRNMLCLSVTMAKALYRAISSIPEEHILSKGKRSNVHHSNGEIGANERRKFG
ncbi:hypothetical protein P3S67_028843 [Capsicum chacoense]